MQEQSTAQTPQYAHAKRYLTFLLGAYHSYMLPPLITDFCEWHSDIQCTGFMMQIVLVRTRKPVLRLFNDTPLAI
jgi:hypothetical protein